MEPEAQFLRPNPTSKPMVSEYDLGALQTQRQDSPTGCARSECTNAKIPNLLGRMRINEQLYNIYVPVNEHWGLQRTPFPRSRPPIYVLDYDPEYEAVSEGTAGFGMPAEMREEEMDSSAGDADGDNHLSAIAGVLEDDNEVAEETSAPSKKRALEVANAGPKGKKPTKK
ncbi:hypothetical protein M408DRAFT_23853 [Serendipita vermifera MAFF 305830]|uniref:Uncharacterized protein n=1 Tax=Serendipita vermifera MAFF 305830 TaxID=933852 RepID=A0A0C2XGC1_SERVB|nr:hypothetical protein M408DRAFT_23853 [Serendipita vermifera MAFF 305830]